jgi:hypothetical protein
MGFTIQISLVHFLFHPSRFRCDILVQWRCATQETRYVMSNNRYGLYGVGLAQPALQDDVLDEFLTRADKEVQIREFYRKRQRIPLCLDHCHADRAGFVVPERDRIGYVLDLFINRDNAMMVKFKLDNTHPAYVQIYDGINQRREAWGLSVWVERLQNRRTGQVSKALTHVALTLDPRFADYNTYMYQYSLNEDTINNVIARQFYKQRDGYCFATAELKRKLAGMCAVREQENENVSHF